MTKQLYYLFLFDDLPLSVPDILSPKVLSLRSCVFLYLTGMLKCESGLISGDRGSGIFTCHVHIRQVDYLKNKREDSRTMLASTLHPINTNYLSPSIFKK